MLFRSACQAAKAGKRVGAAGRAGGWVGSQARAVGGAVAANRIAVLVPCHRVVPRAGGAGAYHWGQDRKRALLTAEGAAP